MLLRIAMAMVLLASVTLAQEHSASRADKPASKAAPAITWATAPQLDSTLLSGALKVSNETDTDLDETVLVVAVNQIGKAFAIGYQHFTLAQHQKDVAVPFGLKLPPGTYMIHVDAFAEILSTHKVFRAGLQTPPWFTITNI